VSERIRIVIADDHAPTRAGIRAVLEDDDFQVCGEAASADAAVEIALEERPAVCLLDINMPGGGIAAAGAISERLPETAIVMLTVSRDDADLFDALRAGASGYLLKDIDRRQLPADLRGVLAGEAPLPRALVTKLIEEFRERGRRRKVLLAERPGVQLRQREWEILELLAEGSWPKGSRPPRSLRGSSSPR
jgi:DNA-binding NarL/FixJ family response regulator